MITIKEIADQLGVSATTVSNVLNGRAGKMSQETRQRVEEALLRNHYVKEKQQRGTAASSGSGLYLSWKEKTCADGSLLW